MTYGPPLHNEEVKGIISLHIDDKHFFTILIPVTYQEISFGLEGNVSFHIYASQRDHRDYYLFDGTDAVWEAAGMLEFQLKDIAEGKCELSRDRVLRMGYEYNKYVHPVRGKDPQFTYPWHDLRYQLWSPPFKRPST